MIDDKTANYTTMTRNDLTTLSKTQSHTCMGHHIHNTTGIRIKKIGSKKGWEGTPDAQTYSKINKN